MLLYPVSATFASERHTPDDFSVKNTFEKKKWKKITLLYYRFRTLSLPDTQIFFNSEHLGGNDDLQKLHAEGKLADMVAKVRAESPGMMKDTWYHPWY